MTNNKFLLNNNLIGDEKNDCIVLLHGFLGSSEIWNPFIHEYEIDFQILTIDLPGHGKSPTLEGELSMRIIAENVKSILEKHNIKSAHFLGHSMGG